MKDLVILPFVFQAIAMVIDEFHFHRKRGLPRWERIGHPLDTLTVLFCFGFVLLFPVSKADAIFYALAAGFSCFFITKDEFVHLEKCSPQEQWLHAILFMLHPLVLIGAGLIGWHPQFSHLRSFLWIQTALTGVFLLYQIFYWNFLWNKQQKSITTSTTLSENVGTQLKMIQ